MNEFYIKKERKTVYKVVDGYLVPLNAPDKPQQANKGCGCQGE